VCALYNMEYVLYNTVCVVQHGIHVAHCTVIYTWSLHQQLCYNHKVPRPSTPQVTVMMISVWTAVALTICPGTPGDPG